MESFTIFLLNSYAMRTLSFVFFFFILAGLNDQINEKKLRYFLCVLFSQDFMYFFFKKLFFFLFFSLTLNERRDQFVRQSAAIAQNPTSREELSTRQKCCSV